MLWQRYNQKTLERFIQGVLDHVDYDAWRTTAQIARLSRNVENAQVGHALRKLVARGQIEASQQLSMVSNKLTTHYRKVKMTKKIYIAAPFFTPEQLSVVQAVEIICSGLGLDYYSPRADGVLKDMTPEERKDAGPKLFALNCKMIRECDAVLALLDYKDTGTTWETGFARGLEKDVFCYRNSAEPLNIMVQQCFDAVVQGDELPRFLSAYAEGLPLDAWGGGIDLKDTY